MRLKSHTTELLLAFLSITSPAVPLAEQTNPAPSVQRESIQDLFSRLTPEQKNQFDDAGKSYKGNQFAEAFAIYKRLLTELPSDAILSKFASEAALNSGDQSFALTTLKPFAQADPDDWQAAALLTRACAESRDTSCRDSGMVHMLDLFRRGITPPNMQQYIVERVKAGENILVIRMSLQPWGPHKVYAIGYVFNDEGKVVWRITLESNDADQSLFAKEHPKEASAGVRRFSLDGYSPTEVASNGQGTASHALYKFFDGQPSYETVRDEFVRIAQRQTGPKS